MSVPVFPCISCNGDYECYEGHLTEEGLQEYKNIRWERFAVKVRKGGPDSDTPVIGELKGIQGLSIAHEDYIVWWVRTGGEWARNRADKFGMNAEELSTLINLLPLFF